MRSGVQKAFGFATTTIQVSFLSFPNIFSVFTTLAFSFHLKTNLSSFLITSMDMSYETREESANNWSDGSFVLEYTKLSKSSRAIEVWTYPDGPDTKNGPIDDSEVLGWLNIPPPRHDGQMPTAGLRLITQCNESGYPKFPMQKETLAHLLREWGFPNPELYWNAFYIGGSAAFVVGTGEDTRISKTKSL
jgi:hypothetical protein